MALVACKKEGQPKTIRQSIEKPVRQASLGVRKVEGSAIDLRASPDGKIVTTTLTIKANDIEKSEDKVTTAGKTK